MFGRLARLGALALLVVACSSTKVAPTGTMTGRLLLSGGPLGRIYPQAGSISAVATTGPGIVSVSTGPGSGHLALPKGPRHTATADSAGHFTLRLPPGRYAVAGTPSHSGGFCTARGVVVIRAGHATTADVVCDIP